MHEHRELLTRMPKYFLDTDEKIGYQILKGKYLFELGDQQAAYDVMSSIDPKLLYPEEYSDLTVDLVFMLLQMGNLPRAASLVEEIKETDFRAYSFLKSYLSELQGDQEAAWQYAQSGENAAGIQIVNIYRDRGQLSKEVEAEINIVKQYEEMIHLHQLKQDMETLSKMSEVLTDAYSKADRLPAMILGPLLIELAYLSTFSTVLKNPSQAKKAWDRFCGSGQSVNHFSKEVQEKADRLRRMFMAGCGDHQ